MLLLLTLISVLMLGSFFMVYGLIYRSMYKRLRYLALSECEFKEKKGELRARHPLMKESRWEPLTDAYNFASQPRTNLNNLAEEKKEMLDSCEQENESLLAADGQYEPGQWKTKEDLSGK